MSDSDQKYGRVQHLAQDEYLLAEDSVVLAGAVEESWRGRYVELFEFSPIPYLVLSQHGYVEEVNLATCQLLGRGASELIGEHLESISTADGRFITRFLERLTQTNNTVSMETRVQATTTYRFVGAPIDDMGQNKIRVSIIEFNPETPDGGNLARLTNVLLQSKDGFLFYDSEGALTRMNRQARTLLRNCPTQTLGGLMAELGAKDFSFETLRTALQKTNLWTQDFESDRKDTVLRCSINAVVDEDANVNEVLVTVREVALQARRSRTAARKVGEQIRDPLSCLTGALDLMDSIEDAESRERLLDIARRNARTIEVALANLLAIADGPIQIMSVSQHAVAIFDRVMSLSRRSFPELRFDFRGDTDFELNCDGPKMIQALANCVTVIARRCASPGVVMCELTHSDSHHVIEFSPRDVPLSELGLEESSATLLEYDFQIAKEIIEQHKGDIVLLESDRPKIRIEIARTV